MIKLVTDTLGPVFSSCLPFVERYAGLTIRVSRRSPILLDENKPDEVQFIEQFFPVSCEDLSDCEDDSFYYKVLPDDSYKSVAYLEQLGSTNIEIGGPKRSIATGDYRLRFVCWLNLQKLGIEDCFGAHLYDVFTIHQINRRFSTDSLLLNNQASISIRDISILRRDPTLVFGSYYYSIKQSYFLYPYDFFAVDFTARLKINLRCLNEIQISEPIECLTKW